MASSNTYKSGDVESNELYITPKAGIQALLDLVDPIRDKHFFDPCAGLLDIANGFRRAGHDVLTNDLIDYGDMYRTDWKEDFLTMDIKKGSHLSQSTVIMNPPFTLTSEFIDKALSFTDRILMFNRLTTLESLKRARKFKSGEWPLKRCNVFGYRVSCDKGVDREKSANSVAYAVFEFDKQYKGDPKLGWIVK